MRTEWKTKAAEQNNANPAIALTSQNEPALRMPLMPCAKTQ
jgi:hypothetical protein